MSFKNRLYYLKVFFLQHKRDFALLVAFFALVAGLFIITAGPKIPVTEEEFQNVLNTGIKAFNNKEYAKAFDNLIYPAEYGYEQASYYLAEMYYFGYGVEQNYNLALKHYTESSDKMFKAKYRLATMAFRGETKEIKKGMATSFLMQSAYAGLKNAQNDLGIYSLLSKDYEQAYFWLSLSATKASEQVQFALKEATEHLSDYKKGLLDSEIKDFVVHK